MSRFLDNLVLDFFLLDTPTVLFMNMITDRMLISHSNRQACLYYMDQQADTDLTEMVKPF